MQQGETGRTPSPRAAFDPMESPRPQSSGSTTLSERELPPRDGGLDDDDDTDGEGGGVPVGVLMQKSCVQEKNKTGGFFQRLVGGGKTAQKYHVGTSVDLDSITSTSEHPTATADDDTQPHESPTRPPMQRVASDILEDIPLNPGDDLEARAAPRSTCSVDDDTRSTSDRHISQHEDEDLIAPQVVIHESPSKPSEVTTAVGGYKHPILHKTSVDGTTTASPPPLLVLLTIISATNLLKVHKFGVQAPYLEMKISSDETQTFRTAEYKRGGTEAHWNQTFTRRVQSLDDTLHIAAKASTTVIGEVTVPLSALHLAATPSNHVLQLSRGKGGDAVGAISLQCRLVDAATSMPTTTAAAAAPVAPLPMPSGQDKPVEPQVSLAKVQYNDVSGGGDDAWDAAIRRGALMFKIPYHQSSASAPKRKWIALADLPKKGLCVTWTDPQHPESASASAHVMALHDVVQVKTGIKTQAFRKQLHAGKANTFFHDDVCFSLISASRSLDLAASSKEEAHVWVASLRRMLQQQTTTAPAKADTTSILTSAKIMKDFKTAATTSSSPRDLAVDTNHHAVWLKDLFRCAKAHQLAEIANYLMEGCPVDLLEPQTGDTILFLACRAGHVALLELCLKWGAKNDPHPTFGDTALQIAVKASQPECVRQLLSIAAKSDMDTEIVNHVDHANEAPLHVAAAQGDVNILQLLLHHGADICVVQANGHTPLHCAVLAGHESCVAYILDVGGDAIINTGDAHGNTPLHCAVSMGHESLVKLLLESAADVTLCNNEQLTPYKMARRTKARAIQALLAIYEPEPPPTPSKEALQTHALAWGTTHSARLQVRDALAKQKGINHPARMMPSPARSTSTLEGDYDSSSSTSTTLGDTATAAAHSSYYHHHHEPYAQQAYNPYHYVPPPSQQYPTYAYHDPMPLMPPPPQSYAWSQEWEVKYTTEGHAYYVNLYTGVSQWEAPPALQGYDPYAYPVVAPVVVPAAPVYDTTASNSQYVRAQLATLRHQQSMPVASSSHPHVLQSSHSDHAIQLASAPSSPTPSPSASPRSKTSFSERRKMEGFKIDTLKVVTTPEPPTTAGAPTTMKLDKCNDDGDIFQKVSCVELRGLMAWQSRSRSPKGKSKTVKVLDIKRANNIVMTLSDFEFNTHFDKITQAIIDMARRLRHHPC
ncbi:Aste57867_16326 [Aphanomyces stellatus]|uniref:Aste57867_16326 protein n=1 Tax=Aphanomyces stellatus TaxID=120398 RepID=A0A485L578_9STRA|nr:hypothetical protein As57867_016269 [Aphanomyces stellatus]VFT93102.1 Aste57867_16326 [Aphanomyces stellatus]